MARLIDLTGQRFGRLTVLERAENYVTPSGEKKSKWNCICDCGEHCTVVGTQLTSGKTKSCGCLSRQMTADRSTRANRFQIAGNIVVVEMSNDNAEMLVDLCIWQEWASKHCWHTNANGYAATRFQGKNTIFHDIIFSGRAAGMCVDHINGNRLDNRLSNLRIVTRKQNRINCGVRKSNKSGITGVSWSNQRMKWVAQIQVDGKSINLGRYENIEDAITARKQAEIKYFGEYRRKEQPETD